MPAGRAPRGRGAARGAAWRRRAGRAPRERGAPRVRVRRRRAGDGCRLLPLRRRRLLGRGRRAAGGPSAAHPGLDPGSTLPGIGCLRRVARGFPMGRPHMVFLDLRTVRLGVAFLGLRMGRPRMGFPGFRTGRPHMVFRGLRTVRLGVAFLGLRMGRPRMGFPGFRTGRPRTASLGCPTARLRAESLVCPTVRPVKVCGGSRTGRPRTVSRGRPTAPRPMVSPGSVAAIPSSVNPEAAGGS